ncbi:hypothetical protein CKO_00374 [Citrobacter koseri ATCC BAA-895]|uniref:Uncharacterized protein n=1 Tax=Citrobacter koseri (strain ATCC BAA-895 / CDC 4225-83 / SGSC4696) TaxID=290338 RepID=A8ADH4_CITK8|nr:hypothetical protein CKO_00374 [Citrobacter koseri ATCC BAA-895]
MKPRLSASRSNSCRREKWRRLAPFFYPGYGKTAPDGAALIGPTIKDRRPDKAFFAAIRHSYALTTAR